MASILTIYDERGGKTRLPLGYGGGLCHVATAPFEAREGGTSVKTPTAEAGLPEAHARAAAPLPQPQRA